MAGFLTNGALSGTLSGLIGDFNSAGNHRQLILFKNNLAVSAATVLADLTESDFATYVRKDLAGTWSPIVRIKDGQFESVTVNFTWPQLSSGSQLIYGWAIADLAHTFILASETLSTPFLISNTSGDFVLSLQCDLWDVPNFP